MPLKRPADLIDIIRPRVAYRRTEDDLINAESAIGRTIFGPVPEGYEREFFHHKKNVWIWHENGVTIRYEVRAHGIFKRVGSGKYEQIKGAELDNFRTAAKTYLKLIKSHVYKINV